MKTKSLIISLAISALFFAFPAVAQETAADPLPVAGQAITVATVNIYGAKIIEQKDNVFQISFNLANRTGIQPEVKYAVALIRQTEQTQIKIDENIYPEVVNLGENQTIAKKITYEAPEYLNGTFQLWITVQNSSGLLLALNSLREVKLDGDNQFLEIDSSSCFLKVSGETENEKYTLRQGVDIESDEKLIGTCEVINHYDKSINFVPQFKTYWRNTFGQLVADNQEPQTAATLNAQEKKEVSFILPKAKEPQAYDAVVTLLEGNDAISNSVAFHYVLRGASATIQSVKLDKDYYQKGEIAKLSFFWTSAADTFPGSRFDATEGGILTAQISVTDKNGQVCANSLNKELTGKTIEEILDLPIISDCANLQISAMIKDASGKTLDQKLYSIESKNLSQAEKPSQPQSQSGKFIFYGLAVIALIIIILAVFFLKKKSVIIILLFFLAGTGIFFSSKVAKAEVFTVGDSSYLITLDKQTYTPGETMTVTVAATDLHCSNDSYTPAGITVIVNGVSQLFYSSAYAQQYWLYTKTYTAPSVSGNYLAEVTLINGGSLGTIPYSVIGPLEASISQSSIQSYQGENFDISWDSKNALSCWVYGFTDKGTYINIAYGILQGSWTETSNTTVGTNYYTNYCYRSINGIIEDKEVRITHTIVAAPTYILTITNSGTGSGIITSSMSADNWLFPGGSIAYNYDSGVSVTLTAAPNPNSIFTGWFSEGCSGTDTCTVLMTKNKTVMATFTLKSSPSNCAPFCVTVNNDCSVPCGGGTKIVEFCTRADCTTFNKTQSCNSQPCPPGYREVAPW